MYCRNFGRTQSLWYQAVTRHLCKESWDKLWWSPSLPLCLGAAFLCRSSLWSQRTHAIVMPAKCLAHPYLLTFQLDLRPASSLRIYQETTALLFLLPVRMKVLLCQMFCHPGLPSSWNLWHSQSCCYLVWYTNCCQPHSLGTFSWHGAALETEVVSFL